MITGAQCRAARALVEVTRGKLSIRTGVEEGIIEHFERQLDQLGSGTIAELQKAL